MSEGTLRPKQADFRVWTDLLANALAVDIQHVIADAGYLVVHTRIAAGQAPRSPRSTSTGSRTV